MANHKSSEKRARSSEKKREHNHRYVATVRTAVKKAAAAIESLKSGTEKDANAVWALLRDAQSKLGKAARKGIVRANTASRKTSRLTQALKKVTGTTAK